LAPSIENPEQDAEKARQRRSHFAQTLNVPQRVRLGASLVAALLAGFLSILPNALLLSHTRRAMRFQRANRVCPQCAKSVSALIGTMAAPPVPAYGMVRMLTLLI
jgi:hypothetical protein